MPALVSIVIAKHWASIKGHSIRTWRGGQWLRGHKKP